MVFRPGQSGNPLGRRPGSRSRFSEAYMRDLAATWEAHGAEAMQKCALIEPSKFVAICASLLPRDVQVSLSARLPGGLDAEDWAIATAVFAAVRDGIPDAGERKPSEVLEFVLAAVRAHSAPQIEGTAQPSAGQDS